MPRFRKPVIKEEEQIKQEQVDEVNPLSKSEKAASNQRPALLFSAKNIAIKKKEDDD